MRKLSCLPVLLLCAGSLFAQSSPSTTTPPAQTGPMRRGGGEPCWQQAGIEKSVIDQVWDIAHETRSKIEGICSSTSLTPQQKQQQVRELREQALQKRQSLLTADQEKALTSCQQQRSGHPGAHGGGPHEGMGMGGGCGDMPRAHRGMPPNGGQGNGNGTGAGSGSTPPPQNQSSPND